MEERREEYSRVPRFRPRLEGCVARDRHFAGLLEVCYVDAFSSVAANIYRSLIMESEDRELAQTYEWIATEELESFRLLGELMLALGGTCALHPIRRVRVSGGSCVGESMLAACIAERERSIDRYETLMSRTGDRVVRSIMAKLLASQRRMLEKITRGRSEKYC